MSPSSTTFAQLGLSAPLLRALSEKNYLHPSPIQAEAIPHLLAGRDVMGSAQTGTGKTAAFALPILQRLSENPLPRTPRSPRALILTPTRELAVQIGDNFTAYGKHLQLRHAVIYGGVGQMPQVRAAHVADIAIATPGRLLDLASQGHIRFDRVEILVLDEADRMLDMGFAPDIKRIIGKLPAQRQSLLFSATMPPSILDLAARVVQKPVRVAMTPETPTVDRIAQSVVHVEHGQKYPCLRQLLGENPKKLVLVFMRTKHGANKLARNLERDGFHAEAIHGNKSQSARQRALESFRSGHTPILVATDVAARGIDVKNISLVVNYDLPEEPEAYVHRIGRTARAGTEGRAISFCESDDRRDLQAIQRMIRKTIPVLKITAAPLEKSAAPRPATPHAPAHVPAHSPAHAAPRAAAHPPAHSHPRATAHSPAHAPAPYREHRPHHESRPRHEPRPRHESTARYESAARHEHAPRTEHAPRSDYAPRPAGTHAPTPHGQRARPAQRSYFQRQRRGTYRSGWQP
ncbi:MAG TPA: DEAD/DEAH box helicase [Opitutales bacterium]|nr:DEAD/DEAH box helicase [Opitutales bacterium]